MTIIHLNLSYNNNNNTFRRSSRISNEILINAGVHVATENDDRQQTHNNNKPWSLLSLYCRLWLTKSRWNLYNSSANSVSGIEKSIKWITGKSTGFYNGNIGCEGPESCVFRFMIYINIQRKQSRHGYKM